MNADLEASPSRPITRIAVAKGLAQEAILEEPEAAQRSESSFLRPRDKKKLTRAKREEQQEHYVFTMPKVTVKTLVDVEGATDSFNAHDFKN